LNHHLIDAILIALPNSLIKYYIILWLINGNAYPIEISKFKIKRKFNLHVIVPLYSENLSYCGKTTNTILFIKIRQPADFLTSNPDNI